MADKRTAGTRLQELRRSNAAGRHADKRTKRQRDRGAARRRAIQDASS